MNVKINPRSSRSEIVGFEGGVLKIKVRAVPEGGKANLELRELVAVALGLAKSRVNIKLGHKSREKVVAIDTDLDRETLENKLSRSGRE
ncbi:MAG: DUF167 domain-containing protein [Patescibacteria group bacterium]